MAFDKTLPIEGALAPTYNNIMRADKIALEAALNAWMYFATGGTQTGQPRQGQARPYFQDAAPTTRLDGDHFDSTDLGCLWIDSNATIDNQFNILTAADGAGTNTWTPISTEIIAVLLAAARTFAEIITFSKQPVFTTGIIDGEAYLVGRNAAGDGNLNLLRTNASDLLELMDGAVLAAATESADGDRTIVDLAYAKTGDTAMHDATGGYNNCDIDGTKTKVYTKYLTGTLDADATTSVAHGVTGIDNILSVVVYCYNSSLSVYYVSETFAGAGADSAYTVRYDGTNVIIDSVGSDLQSQKYRIKIDYKL